MSMTDKQINKLVNFAGYGNPAGRMWFIGIEEGGDLGSKLRTRLRFKQIEDLRRAQIRLGYHEFHIGPQRIQRTWRGLCITALAASGQAIERETIRAYQTNFLGRKDGETFLTEIFPLPKKKTRMWPYAHLIPRYKSEQEYKASVLPQRMDLLNQLLSKHADSIQLIVAYGKACWPHFESLFRHRSFALDGPFKVSRQEGLPLIVLTPHITAREMNIGIKKLIELASTLQNSQSLSTSAGRPARSRAQGFQSTVMPFTSSSRPLPQVDPGCRR